MKCSVCGVFVKDGNLGKHYDKAHPGDTRPAIPLLKKQPKIRLAREPLSTKTKGVIIGLVFFIVLVSAGLYLVPVATDDRDCVGHAAMAYHWHADLLVYEDGNLITIPADTGIEPGCMGPIHTHGTDNKIHMEPSDADVRFTVGNFFEVWGRPFRNPQSMFVDGESITPSPDVVLLDGMVVEVYYP